METNFAGKKLESYIAAVRLKIMSGSEKTERTGTQTFPP